MTPDSMPPYKHSHVETTGTSVVDGSCADRAAIRAGGAARENIADRDRGYLAPVVAAQSELDAEVARTRVDEVDAEIDDARAAALAEAEKARAAAVVFGFIARATLLTGAVAAFFAAAGGRHRDEGPGFDIFAARR